MGEYICEKCAEVFEHDKRPRDCPKCHHKYVRELPTWPGKYFFFECTYCLYRFVTKAKPAENCLKCNAEDSFLKRIPQEKVVICDHCGQIMFTQSHINSHFCLEKDRNQYWWYKLKGEFEWKT